ncbi:MAG TPA: cell division protein ZipA C-terminal FtsZ-binding domain-containing protein [Steroidobacteraceae bacterium]|jgi:cell division protein ZipA
MHLAGLMSQLRWTLLVIGVLFIVALTWWERRRPRQASGRDNERGTPRETGDAPRMARDPALTLPEMRAREPLVPHGLPVVEIADLPAMPPRLRPAAAAPVAPLVEDEDDAELEFEDEPDEEPLGAESGPDAAEIAVPAASVPPTVAPALPREALPEPPHAEAPVVEWPPDEQRRVVALRLVAPQPERFAGRSLRQALAAEGFVLGQFSIFHKGDEERRAVLSAASLTRPGTFDAETMDSQHYGGLSLFAVLPGPKAPPQAFDELVITARSLNDRLHGVLQDEQGSPLTPQRIAVLRERLSAVS